MNQITNTKDLIGKTISKILETEYDNLWIKFSDNSFCIFSLEGEEMDKIKINNYLCDETSIELVHLNIVSEEKNKLLTSLKIEKKINQELKSLKKKHENQN